MGFEKAVGSTYHQPASSGMLKEQGSCQKLYVAKSLWQVRYERVNAQIVQSLSVPAGEKCNCSTKELKDLESMSVMGRTGCHESINWARGGTAIKCLPSPHQNTNKSLPKISQFLLTNTRWRCQHSKGPCHGQGN